MLAFHIYNKNSKNIWKLIFLQKKKHIKVLKAFSEKIYGRQFSWRMLNSVKYNSQRKKKNCWKKKMKGKFINFHFERNNQKRKKNHLLIGFFRRIIFILGCWTTIITHCLRLSTLIKEIFSTILTAHTNQQNAFSYGKISTLYHKVSHSLASIFSVSIFPPHLLWKTLFFVFHQKKTLEILANDMKKMYTCFTKHKSRVFH